MGSKAPLESLLKDSEVAKLLGQSVRTLRKNRLLGRGPRFRRLGRSVRYHPADLRAYIDACSVGGSGIAA
jgi:hypothetical protein